MPGQATDLNQWIADLGTAIARAALPDPMSADTLYRTGTAMLAFVVYPDGGIGDIRVVGSSGDASLDRRAVAKLRRAEPLPAGPETAIKRTQVAVMTVAERVAVETVRDDTVDRRTLATA